MLELKENLQDIPLFPETVRMMQLREPTDRELDYCRNLDKFKSNQKHLSKNTRVLDSEELSDLKNIISSAVNRYFREVFLPRDNVSLRITQSWCTYCDGSSSHHRHRHPNSAFSGVYYPQSNSPNDKIRFHHPRQDIDMVKFYSDEYNMANSETWWLPAQTGTLLMFPAHLAHSVPILPERTSERISLAFNTFFVGTIGNEYDFDLVHLEEE